MGFISKLLYSLKSLTKEKKGQSRVESCCGEVLTCQLCDLPLTVMAGTGVSGNRTPKNLECVETYCIQFTAPAPRFHKYL